jgi:hypothetical protein
VKFETVTADDRPLITDWMSQDIDPVHHSGNPEFFYTAAPGSLLAFKVTDEIGTVCFCRLDKEDEAVRWHCQFAPYDAVDKKRLVQNMLQGVPAMIDWIKKTGAKQVVFDSVSPRLIKFLEQYEFQKSLVAENDYALHLV